jgi:hypothetical protein
MDDPPPPGKRQYTTTTTTEAEAEQEPTSIRVEERAVDIIDQKKKNARMTTISIIDLLRSLPANIVAHYVYPFAVKVIQNRNELIKAIDEFLVDGNDGNNRVRYPIGDWDVSRVEDFTSVFDHIRNPKARQF